MTGGQIACYVVAIVVGWIFGRELAFWQIRRKARKQRGRYV